MTESGVKLIGWVGLAALVSATLAIPQPVDPWELPSLVLSREASTEAIEMQRALAAEAPRSSTADTLRSLFVDHGRAEADPPYEALEYDRRQASIHATVRSLVAQHGPAAVDALRAEAVETFVRLFYDDVEGASGDEDDETVGRIGGFHEIARRYGLVVNGVVIAPELTVRALYKARWNAIHRREFVEGFTPIELQAYWGWLALHGWGRPLRDREDALVAFREAGGRGALEAAALFDLLGGRPERAATSLQALYETQGELRLRNLGLGALHAALSSGMGP